MPNIFNILADDVDSEVVMSEAKPLFDVKAYVFALDQHWATPTAIPLAPQGALYMMTWATYHALVGRNPTLQTSTIVVGGKLDWSEDVHHFPNMAAFGKNADALLDRPIRVLVTNDDMVTGLRDAFGFILGDLEVHPGEPTDRPIDVGTALQKQEFEQVDDMTWTTPLPAPIPLTRQTAIYIQLDELTN